jgi:hypothetical protein
VVFGINGEGRETVTDNEGIYYFVGIPAGALCVVSIEHQLYRFEPPTHTLSLISSATHLDFQAAKDTKPK